MSSFSKETSLADIVTKSPSTAALFGQMGIDFCCGGERSLAEAAAERGLDPETLLVTLEAAAATHDAGDGAHDVAGLSTNDLVDHIVSQHHDKLRKDLPMIEELLDTVVRVHGEADPTLAPLRERFVEVSRDLSEHMQLEEEKLFPACRASHEGSISADSELIEELTHQHTDTGAALEDLRRLGGGYDEQSAHCGTHRFLLQSLAGFEHDLHVHVHEENNVLFPRARTALEAASTK